jgi:hypothetical protein
MTTNRLEKLRDSALDLYTHSDQLRQLAEEASEMSADVNRLFRGRIEPKKLMGEIADTYFMIEQARKILGEELFQECLTETLDKVEAAQRKRIEVLRDR